MDPDWDASLGIRNEHDLSNRKLAQNQTELSRQISELRNAVEVQGEMIRRLVGMLEGRVGYDHDGDGMMVTGTEVGEMRVGSLAKGKGKEDLNGHASTDRSTEAS